MNPGTRERFARTAGPLAAALAWTVAGCGPALAANCPSRPVRIALPDIPLGEHLKGRGDAFSDADAGYFVRELRAVERQLGCRFELTRLPFRRLFHDIGAGTIDLIAPITEAQARPLSLRLPTRTGAVRSDWAAIRSDLQLAILKSRQDELEGAWQVMRRPTGVVAAVNGGHGLVHAKENDWKAQGVQTIEKGLAMLELGRVDYLLIGAELLAVAEPVQAGRVLVLNPPALREHYYFVARPAFADSHAEFVSAFWAAMCRASAERRGETAVCKP